MPKNIQWDFPGGTVDKNLPANSGDTGSIPGPGRCHTLQSNWASEPQPLAHALEPASHNYWAHVPQLLKPDCLEPVLHNKRNHCSEKTEHNNE